MSGTREKLDWPLDHRLMQDQSSLNRLAELTKYMEEKSKHTTTAKVAEGYWQEDKSMDSGKDN